jgi:hypothetical protein
LFALYKQGKADEYATHYKQAKQLHDELKLPLNHLLTYSFILAFKQVPLLPETLETMARMFLEFHQVNLQVRAEDILFVVQELSGFSIHALIVSQQYQKYLLGLIADTSSPRWPNWPRRTSINCLG